MQSVKGIKLIWVICHSGVRGNELAHTELKEALAQPIEFRTVVHTDWTPCTR